MLCCILRLFMFCQRLRPVGNSFWCFVVLLLQPNTFNLIIARVCTDCSATVLRGKVNTGGSISQFCSVFMTENSAADSMPKSFD